MKTMMVTLLLCFSSFALANEILEAQNFALDKIRESRSTMQSFDTNELPGFSQTPKEVKLKPQEKLELTRKAIAFANQDEKAKEVMESAKVFKNKTLTPVEEVNAKSAQNTEDDVSNVECADGSCIETKSEESSDFGEGAVELGALGDTAKDVKEKQVHAGEFGIFKGGNITCRTVFGEHRTNCCGDENGFCTEGERALSRAKKLGRAIQVSGDKYCSKKRWWGCVQKRESWCVFDSKLAKIVQEEGEHQGKRSDFGRVGGRDNWADCRGMSAAEVSSINYDTTEMKQALSSLESDYTSKKTLPSADDIKNKTQDGMNKNQEASYE